MADEPGSAGPDDLTSFLTFRFTDDQWDRITKHSDLPPQARTDFEDCIRRYLFSQARMPHRSAAQRRKARKRLSQKIRDVLEDTEWPSGSLDPVKNLKIRFVKLELMLLAAELARSDDPGTPRPGPKWSHAAHQFVVCVADTFERHAELPANRSEKLHGFVPFMEALVAAVDLDIGPGTIVEALKKRR